MASTLHFLRRLRRHGVPGRAPAVAVPVDRMAAIEAELAGVFTALEPVVQECRRIVEQASEEARRLVDDARQEGRRTVERASEQAVALAAAEAADELARLGRESEQLLASARVEADRVAEQSFRREPKLQDRIIRYTLSLPGLDHGGR